MIELLNQTARSWADAFGPALVQNTIFLGLLLLVLSRLRRISAGMKQALATIGVAKLLLPPFVPVGMGAPGSHEARSVTEAAASVVLVPSPAGVVEGSAPGTELSLLGLAFLIWAAATGLVLAGSLLSTVRLAWALRDASPVTGPEVRAELLGTGIGVRRSGRTGMPLTWGLRPRTIFVPPLWDDWSPECRRQVLRHELAHIRRFDGPVQFLQIWARALYFFHPLVHLLHRRLEEYREMACDDAASGSARASRLAYSRNLVEIAESVTRGPVPVETASALFGRRRELLNRVRYQTEGRSIMSVTRKGAVLAAAVLLVLPFSLYLSDTTPEAPGGAAVAGAKTGSGAPAVTIALDQADAALPEAKAEQLLAKKVTKATENIDPNAVIRIVCDEKVPMATLFAVQDLLMDQGLYRVSYAVGEKKGLPLVLPAPKMKQQLARVSPEHLAAVHLTAGGGVLLDGRKAKPGAVAEWIQKRLQADSMLVVLLSADPDARYGQFTDALAQAKQAGAERISVGPPMKIKKRG